MAMVMAVVMLMILIRRNTIRSEIKREREMGGKRKQKLEKEERPSHNTDMNYIHSSPHLLTLFCSKMDSLTRHYNVCLPRQYD